MKAYLKLTIEAVLFDLGNTLVYSCPEETFHEILRAHGIVEPIDRVKQAMIKGNQEFDIEKHMHLPAHEFYTEWNLVELKHLGIIDQAKAEKLAQEIDSEWFEFAQLRLYPDVKPTLQRLKQMGLILGIITGGYEEDVKKILPKVGLQDVFDVCVGVNTIGKRKPSPEVFQYALKKLGLTPREAVFVGDDLKADYLGAEKAGLTAVLIRREGSATSDVRCIKRLDEIFEVLAEINP
jgi:putative hydrolase of the HAD superfamily